MLVSHSNLSGRVLRALGRAHVLDGSDRSPQAGIGSGEAGLTAIPLRAKWASCMCGSMPIAKPSGGDFVLNVARRTGEHKNSTATGGDSRVMAYVCQ